MLNSQKWPKAHKSGFQQGFQRKKGVPARFRQRVPAHKGVPARDSSRGSKTFVSPLFPCISAHMPLLAPLVEWTKAAWAAVGTRGYAGPDGLGCTDLTAHPDTKVVIPPGTTIARIRLTRTLFADDKQPCALTDWLHGVLEDNPHMPILQVRLHADDMDDVVQACTGRADIKLPALVVLWKSPLAGATCFTSAKRVDQISAKSVAIRGTPNVQHPLSRW